jgi:hypothetical protein
MDRSTAQTRIDDIDEKLALGAASVTHNGRTITYDLPALRRERDRLQAWLNRGAGGKNIRVGRYNTSFTR